MLGSNIFNLLAVVGVAGVIAPMESIAAEVLSRDWPTMVGMTVALSIMAYGFRGQGHINRFEGFLLLASDVAYDAYLMITVTGAAS